MMRLKADYVEGVCLFFIQSARRFRLLSCSMESQLSSIYIANSLKPVIHPPWKSLQSCILADNNVLVFAAAIADNINYLVFCQFSLGISNQRIYTELLNYKQLKALGNLN